MRLLLAFLAGAATALALHYHLPRASARILTANQAPTPHERQPKYMTYRSGERTNG